MRFDVASISKLFTSVAVLQLVAAGRLDPDASIHRYAEITSTAIDPAVTLRHLLTNISGVADIAEVGERENYAAIFRTVPCHAVVTLHDFLSLFEDDGTEQFVEWVTQQWARILERRDSRCYGSHAEPVVQLPTRATLPGSGRLNPSGQLPSDSFERPVRHCSGSRCTPPEHDRGFHT